MNHMHDLNLRKICSEMCGGFADMFASGEFTRSSYADLYDSAKKRWSRYPSGLGQARSSLAAASLPSGLVIFAGGVSAGSVNSNSVLVTETPEFVIKSP